MIGHLYTLLLKKLGVVAPLTPPPNEYSATIMRATPINSTVTALLDRIAQQAGTMSDTLNQATIMRAASVNSTGTMRADALNQTANLS